MFLHGGAIEFKGGAYLFLGPANAGKTTVVRRFSGICRVLHDDFLAVEEKNGTLLVAGAQKPGKVITEFYPLKKVFFVKKEYERVSYTVSVSKEDFWFLLLREGDFLNAPLLLDAFLNYPAFFLFHNLSDEVSLLGEVVFDV